MATFKLSSKAKGDLLKIGRYTQKRWDKRQRNTYLKMLDDAFHVLGDNPNIGKPCDFVKKSYRRYPQGSHVIFYTSGPTASIEIVRVLHKNMDVLSQFSGG
jgi:toxin ParE1/3/4